MKLRDAWNGFLARRYARYAGTVGWIDGAQNYPGEENFIQATLYGDAGTSVSEAHPAAEVLKIREPAALK